MSGGLAYHALTLPSHTHYAGIHCVRGWGGRQLLGIYGDPGERQGQRLAAGGQPALGKKWTPWTGTLQWQWAVHIDWSVK